jgi:hypothetical protein
MLYTVLVEITHGEVAPPEQRWLANCTLEKGKLMRTIGDYFIKGGKVIRGEKKLPVEDGRTTIIEHIEQKGWYYYN